MENIIITNREAYLVEEKSNNENESYLNKYENISEKNTTQADKILSLINRENEAENFESNTNPKLTRSFSEKSPISSLDSINQDILATEETENDLKKNKNNRKVNPKSLIKAYIGNVSEAHQFILDNEFILKGYRINFHSCKRISKSFCLCHNETINIWTHFIGSVLIILFMFLVIFNIGPINPDNFLTNNSFERDAIENYNRRSIYENVLNYDTHNDFNVSQNRNSTSSFLFEIGNNLNFEYSSAYEKIKKANNDFIKSNKNANNRERIIENNSVDISEINKLKLLNIFNFEIPEGNYEADHSLVKNKVDEEGKKFIENHSIVIDKFNIYLFN